MTLDGRNRHNTRQAIRRCVVLVAATGLGCADAVAPVATVDGLWDFTSALTLPGTGTPCADSGSFVLHQVGASVTGRAEFVRTCQGAGSSVVSTSHETDSIAGTISGRVVAFELRALPGNWLLCNDTLTIGAASTSLAGTGACGFIPTTRTGVRAADVASAVMRPDSMSLVSGVSSSFSADFRTQSGMRAFLRPVTWATANAAVAIVSASGIVTAVGAGTTSISATSGGRTASGTVSVPAAVGFVAVGAGNARTCALTAAGDAYCWGTPVVGPPSGPVPGALAGGLHFVQLAMGADFACGRTSANASWCWGSGTFGQLGTGQVTSAIAPQPVQGGLAFVSLTAGGDHACGLTAAGAAWCWGADSVGQLGRNGTGGSSVPVPVSSGIVFASLSAGPRHTCGVATDGSLYCWGENVMRQLGDSTAINRAVPVLVNGGHTWKAVSAGYWKTCALTTGGAAYCWGSAGFGGSLGTPNAIEPVPAPVLGGHTFTAITAGNNQACGIDAAGAAWCWGVNSFGQVGNGAVGAAVLAPAPVTGGLTFATISAGSYDYSDEAINGGTAAHTCGVTAGATVYCWGVNNAGQLGIGSTGFQGVSTPTKVAGQP
jgi:alpha-tubulin suppressor-like RCC1 family protein